MKVPLVAIIGRANVGKSTLFNKIVKQRSAIVNNTPGVTRDRIYGRTTWQGKPLDVVDTGGISCDSESSIENLVKEQAQLAMDEADCLIFVVDGQQGPSPEDKELIREIRKSKKPLLLAVNKIDHPSHESRMYDFSELGVEQTFPLSAEHATGIADLMEHAASLLPETVVEESTDAVKIALIGRPNVGKSSMINQLLNSGRCIVSEVPGTTRDTVDSDLIFNKKKYILIDTAGIRRKGKTVQLLEKYSVIMAIKAIERCDIAVIVLDSPKGISDQDATIAGYAFEKGRGCILLANKWDLVDIQEQPFPTFEEQVKRKMKFLEFAPILPVSAKTGEGVLKLFPLVEEVYGEYSKEIPTVQLNNCFERAIKKNPMSQYKGKFLKLFYSTQVKTRPPTFRCFVNYPKGIHFSYRRYLTNSLRGAFGFSGTPVRLVFSERHTRQ